MTFGAVHGDGLFGNQDMGTSIMTASIFQAGRDLSYVGSCGLGPYGPIESSAPPSCDPTWGHELCVPSLPGVGQLLDLLGMIRRHVSTFGGVVRQMK